MQPTFGYLIGFIAGSYITGTVAHSGKPTAKRILTGCFAGLAVVYALGMFYCDQYDVLLIFDEVATGFGRTGNRFVADLVLPDILVLGKALTGGYTGHAVTVATRRVWEGFLSDDTAHAFMHGPTFMGNALACCAALKSIELFERDDYISKIHRIEEITRREMAGFADPRIKEVRIMGGCVCIEVYDGKVLDGFRKFAYERGVFSRTFLKYMYAMVPYVISESELIQILDTMKAWFA